MARRLIDAIRPATACESSVEIAATSAASRLLTRQNSRALSSLENATTPAHVAPFSWKTISAPAESSSRWISLGIGSDSRAFDRELARANRRRALADQRGIGVVVLAAQVQERIDVDVVELELGNRTLGRLAVGRFDDRIVERAALRGLEILARRKSVTRRVCPSESCRG